MRAMWCNDASKCTEAKEVPVEDSSSQDYPSNERWLQATDIHNPPLVLYMREIKAENLQVVLVKNSNSLRGDGEICK